MTTEKEQRSMEKKEMEDGIKKYDVSHKIKILTVSDLHFRDLKELNNIQKRLRKELEIYQYQWVELAFQDMLNGTENMANWNSIESVNMKLSESIISIADVQSEQLRHIGNIDFSRILLSEFINSGSLRKSIDTAYEIVQEKFSETEIEDNKLESEFSSAEELEEAVNEHINNPRGFQERFANWSQKKKIQYFIIWRIICFLWSNFCQPYFQDNIGKPVTSYIVSNVKELPEKGAKVVCQLKQNIEAIILENTIYYYKVSFIDENGNVREGYVAKKNLKVLDEEEDVERDKEEEALNESK